MPGETDGACHLTARMKALQYDSTASMRFLRLNLVRTAFGVAVGVLIAGVFLSFWSISRLIEASNSVSHTHAVLDRTDDLLVAVLQSVTTAREVDTSGDERFHRQAVQSIQSAISDVERLTTDNSRQQRRIAALKAPIAEMIALQRQRMDLIKAQGRDPATIRFLRGRENAFTDQIQYVLSEMENEEEALLSGRSQEERRRARVSRSALIAGSVLSFAILFATYYHLEREIARRRRSEARLVHLNRLFAVLSQTNVAIVHVRNRDDLFPEVCRVAVEHGQFAMAWIGLLDPASGLIKPAAWWGREEGFLENLHISIAGEPAGRGPTGVALVEGTHFVCDDIAADVRMLPCRDKALGRGYRSGATFPINVQERPVGTFTVYANEAGFFDDETVRLLDEVASDLSFALHTIEQEEQRKTAEQALRESEERFRQMAETINEVFWMADGKRSKVTYVSPAYEQIWGRSRESIYKDGRSFLDAVHPEDRERVMAAFERLIRNGEFDEEFRIEHADGSVRSIWDRAFPIRDASGRIYRLAGITQDTTERKKAENEVRRLNEQLEYRIVERTAELADVNSQLARRNEELARVSRMKTEFLARMSHELRTPLNSIVGFSDLLAEATEGPLSETYCDYIRHVQEGAHHLLALVNDILDLSRIEAGRTDLRQEEFAAADAILEVLSVTRPLADMKKIDVRSEVASALAVYADRTRFKQIFYNLLSNAVKFTPLEGAVGVSAYPGDGEVRFSVRDTGIGIPPEEHAAIFEEFHQVGPATSGVKEGAGLGLAITKRLVELHNGRIWVESAPGEGSQFFFTMPAMRAGKDGSNNPYWHTGAA
jgi:PAS domain S-box-containing protein